MTIFNDKTAVWGSQQVQAKTLSHLSTDAPSRLGLVNKAWPAVIPTVMKTTEELVFWATLSLQAGHRNPLSVQNYACVSRFSSREITKYKTTTSR